MKCPLCKGEMISGISVMPYVLDGERVIVVLNVPVLVCQECGDEFVDIDTVRNIEKTLERVERNSIRMGFVGYQKAA